MSMNTPPTTPTPKTAPGAPMKTNYTKTFGDHIDTLKTGFTGLFRSPKKSNTTQTAGKSKKRKGAKSKKRTHYKKGMSSKTRKGRKDFVTHKGNKYYNRKGHRQGTNKKGTRKVPYKR